MFVSVLEWLVTPGRDDRGLLFDVVVMARRSGEPTMRRCAIALSVYVGLAVCFGIWTWFFHGQQFAVEFFAGWLTEYSLSVDNLFIFVIIMTSFNVPKVYQRQALFVGIVIALIFRGIFIAAWRGGHSAILVGFSTFSAHFWCTPHCGWPAARAHDADTENAAFEFARRHLKVTDTWHGLKLYVKEGSQRSIDPDVAGRPRRSAPPT